MFIKNINDVIRIISIIVVYLLVLRDSKPFLPVVFIMIILSSLITYQRFGYLKLDSILINGIIVYSTVTFLYKNQLEKINSQCWHYDRDKSSCVSDESQNMCDYSSKDSCDIDTTGKISITDTTEKPDTIEKTDTAEKTDTTTTKRDTYSPTSPDNTKKVNCNNNKTNLLTKSLWTCVDNTKPIVYHVTNIYEKYKKYISIFLIGLIIYLILTNKTTKNISNIPKAMTNIVSQIPKAVSQIPKAVSQIPNMSKNIPKFPSQLKMPYTMPKLN